MCDIFLRYFRRRDDSRNCSQEIVPVRVISVNALLDARGRVSRYGIWRATVLEDLRRQFTRAMNAEYECGIVKV